MEKHNQGPEIERARELRSHATKSESVLWELLRAKQLCGLKFRRQFSIGPFFVDFACRKKRLVVEVDGDYHDYIVENDRARETYLRGKGWDVVRFSVDEVMDDPESIAIAIAKRLGLPFEFERRKGTGSGLRTLSDKTKRRRLPSQ